MTLARGTVAPVAAGGGIGILGGLIGLGGAEFRLPLLIGLFGFGALEAVVLNKAISLVVVASALPFRLGTVPLEALWSNADVVLNLLTGSLLGAWMAAGWASRLASERLYKVIAILLLVIALVLWFGHGSNGTGAPLFAGYRQWVAGGIAGLTIGSVASIMGVAGGELLIPTLVILFGADLKLAGSLSLVVSLPTMVVGFVRYSRAGAIGVLLSNRRFAGLMAVGSIVGTWTGGKLLGIVPEDVLLPVLSVILVLSAVKVWRH